MRKLAQRSADSAKEISNLIKDSVRKVEEGSKLVDASGRALKDIVLGVGKVSSFVAEIAAASREQSVGIEQVDKAVIQMDEMTQQNAAMVEQASAASKALEERARDLREVMRFFDVGEVAGETRALAPPGREV